MAGLPGYLRSSSYQVGTLFALLMLVGIFFVSYWLVIASGDTLLRESEEAVRAEIRAFRTAERLGGLAAVEELLRSRLADETSAYFYGLRNSGGELVLGNLPEWPQGPLQRLKEGLVLIEIDHDLDTGIDPSARVGSLHFDVMAKVHTLDNGYHLLVGRDVDDLQIAQFVAGSFGWLMILILLLICALSYGVAYYVASRIDRIADTAGRIIRTGDLAQRLPVDSNWDDLSKLAKLLNRMLAELELRVDGIKSVSDNIAHDLRTPLMRLRAAVEDETAGGCRDRLLQEIDHILGIFRSLLRISDIEAGKQALTVKPLDLGALLTDAAGVYEPLAAERDISLLADTSTTSALGDRDLVFQAVVNLLDNALKFTPPGGVVRCCCGAIDGSAYIEIRDSGPGIPAADRERVLQRFTRLEQSRHAPGNGLGLPLVVAIAHRHGGRLELDSGNPHSDTPGLRARVYLPGLQHRQLSADAA
jgi:signal transduction histidine kinase